MRFFATCRKKGVGKEKLICSDDEGWLTMSSQLSDGCKHFKVGKSAPFLPSTGRLKTPDPKVLYSML